MNADKKLYNDFNSYLRRTYGGKTKRIPLNSSLGCPNRENGRIGCIYCLNGSSSPSSKGFLSVSEQLKEFIFKYRLSKENTSCNLIAYFQAYTNTYTNSSKLFEMLFPVSSFTEIKAVAIGTRPDCIDPLKLATIKKAVPEKDIWIEYGLQSISSKTLKFIKRGHDVKAFQKAIKLTKQYEIKTGVHVILGFPWEKKKYIIKLARFISECDLDFIKIHLLHVLKNTALEKMYMSKRITLPSFKNYVHMASDLIENLPKKIVIQRLTGEGSKNNHVAPLWALKKTKVIQAINDELIKRGSFQGKYA